VGSGFKEAGDDAEAVEGIANAKSAYPVNLAPTMLAFSNGRIFDYARAGEVSGC